MDEYHHHFILPSLWRFSSLKHKCLISVHSNTDQNIKPLQLKTPPQLNPPALAWYIWPQFNTIEYAVSYGKDDQLFNRGADVDGSPSSKRPDISFRISDPKNPVDESLKPHAKVKYCIQPVKGDDSSCAGVQVYSTDHLCPPFDRQPNKNLFQGSFGVEYSVNSHIYLCPFSPFETVQCYGFEDDLTYRLSHPEYLFKLHHAVPAHTSAWIFDHVFDRLIEIRAGCLKHYSHPNHTRSTSRISKTSCGASVSISSH